MKKILPVVLCIIMCGVLFSGCSSEKEPETTTAVPAATTPDSSVYGTWIEDYFDSGYTFNSDGTGTDIFWDLSFTYSADGAGNLHIMYDDAELYGDTYYSYTTDGETLTMVMKDDDTPYTYTKQ